MGNFAGSLGSHFTLNTDVFEVATNIAANTSTVRTHTYITCDSTGTGVFSGGATWNANCNGNTASGGFSYDFRGNANTLDLSTYDTLVGHDANGNGSIGWSGASNMNNSPYVTTANTSGGLGLSRLPLAPTISAININNIKPTTATLSGSLSSYGHGTAGTVEGFYRLGSAGGFTSLGVQAYSGSNTWSVTGLKPGTVYQYTVNATNNNGDVANGTYFSFKTQAVSGMISVMRGII